MIYYLFLLITSVAYIISSNELPPRAIIAAKPALDNARFAYINPRKAVLFQAISVPSLIDLIQDFAQDAELDKKFKQAVVIGNPKFVRQNIDKLSQRIPEMGVIRRIQAFVAAKDIIPYKDYPTAVRLIKNGVSQNALKHALFAVIAQPDITAVRFLLTYGAQSNCKDQNGDTPLIATLKIKNPETVIQIVEALLLYGADPNLTNNHQESFLSILETKQYSPQVLRDLHDLCKQHADKRNQN